MIARPNNRIQIQTLCWLHARGCYLIVYGAYVSSATLENNELPAVLPKRSACSSVEACSSLQTCLSRDDEFPACVFVTQEGGERKALRWQCGHLKECNCDDERAEGRCNGKGPRERPQVATALCGPRITRVGQTWNTTAFTRQRRNLSVEKKGPFVYSLAVNAQS